MTAAKLMLKENMGYIVGDIDFSSVIQLRRAGEAAMMAEKTIVFDFSSVAHCDSSALALLIAWQRFAKKQAVQIQFFNVPASLVAFAKVCHVQEILALAK